VNVKIVKGDLLTQDVEAIVNAWNRNVIPWWLLLPRGVSGAMKRAAGYEPFRELARAGRIPAGGAVVTGAGRLRFKAIIHVAGLNLFWRSSEEIVRKCVRSALSVAAARQFRSVAMPLIGAGTGGQDPERVQAIMADEALKTDYAGDVVIVRYRV
jgi:O-acetyl-ADP-ribose deacetylase (regulator of RNase III)